jgi:hypothetical protein
VAVLDLEVVSLTLKLQVVSLTLKLWLKSGVKSDLEVGGVSCGGP